MRDSTSTVRRGCRRRRPSALTRDANRTLPREQLANLPREHLHRRKRRAELLQVGGSVPPLANLREERVLQSPVSQLRGCERSEVLDELDHGVDPTVRCGLRDRSTIVVVQDI